MTYLDVYKNGIVKVSDVEKAFRKDTILITIIYANNEIGTIQPIAEIGSYKNHRAKTINSSTAKGQVASRPIFPYRCVPSGFVFGFVRKKSQYRRDDS